MPTQARCAGARARSLPRPRAPLAQMRVPARVAVHENARQQRDRTWTSSASAGCMRSAAGGSGAHRRHLHGQLLRHAGLAHVGDEQQVLLAVRQRARALCQALPAPEPLDTIDTPEPSGGGHGRPVERCGAVAWSINALAPNSALSIVPSSAPRCCASRARLPRAPDAAAVPARAAALDCTEARRPASARGAGRRCRVLREDQQAEEGVRSRTARCAQRQSRARRAPVPRAAGRWRPARRHGRSCAARRAWGSPRPGLCARVQKERTEGGRARTPRQAPGSPESVLACSRRRCTRAQALHGKAAAHVERPAPRSRVSTETRRGPGAAPGSASQCCVHAAMKRRTRARSPSSRPDIASRTVNCLLARHAGVHRVLECASAWCSSHTKLEPGCCVSSPCSSLPDSRYTLSHSQRGPTTLWQHARALAAAARCYRRYLLNRISHPRKPSGLWGIGLLLRNAWQRMPCPPTRLCM